LLHTRVPEVIPRKSKAYRGVAVKRVPADQLGLGRPGPALTVGIDVGQYRCHAVARWPDGAFKRPWIIAHPAEIPDRVASSPAEANSRCRPAPSGDRSRGLRSEVAAEADADVALRIVADRPSGE
jgi:hypothetical protein